MAQSTHGMSAAKLMLELDGADAGFLLTAEGGEPFAPVVSEHVDPDGPVRKHIGIVEYAPLKISFSTGMGQPLYQWMADWLKGLRPARSGAVVLLNHNFVEQSRLEFDKALITELAFPNLDADTNDRAEFTLTLESERTRVGKASAGTQKAGLIGTTPKGLLASNFRLTIDKLPTAGVNRVEPIVVKQPIKRDDVRNVTPQDPLEIPDLVFTVPESDAGEYLSWFEEFAIMGNGGAKNERTGTLELLGSRNSTALFTLTLSNLGVYRIHRERIQASAAIIARVRVVAYCEQIGFAAAPETSGAARTAPAASPAAAPPSSGTAAAAPSSAATDTLVADALIRLIRGRLQDGGTLGGSLSPANAPRQGNAEPQLIARRLLATVHPDAPDLSSSPGRDGGVAIGVRWATDLATLDELNQIAALEPRDWTAVRLEAPHSLITLLVGEGVLPVGADEGSIELERDPFVEGIVSGAAQVLNSAAPHLVGGS